MRRGVKNTEGMQSLGNLGTVGKQSFRDRPFPLAVHVIHESIQG